jgi:hypothetical protein
VHLLGKCSGLSFYFNCWIGSRVLPVTRSTGVKPVLDLLVEMGFQPFLFHRCLLTPVWWLVIFIFPFHSYFFPVTLI